MMWLLYTWGRHGCCRWKDVEAKFNLAEQAWGAFIKAVVSDASDFAEGAPLFGHFIGFAYYNLEKPEKCKQSIVSATRTLGKVRFLEVVAFLGDCQNNPTDNSNRFVLFTLKTSYKNDKSLRYFS